MVVIAEVEGAPLHLVALARNVAHDFFPPALRRQEAIVLDAGLPRVTLPAEQGAAPAQRVTGDIEVSGSGRARVRATFALVGAAAAELRQAILGVPAAERSAILAERFVPSLVPGATADSGAIVLRGLEDWEGPLELDFVAETGGIVRPARDGLFLLPLFQSGVESAFARLPARTTTELVGEVDVQVTLRVRGPGMPRAPEGAAIQGPGGASASFAPSVDPDGAVRLERRVRVPLAAIRVADYPAFAQFCRAASEIEERSVLFTGR
jgi:hypothetical protein